jgi:hypothetical protein
MRTPTERLTNTCRKRTQYQLLDARTINNQDISYFAATNCLAHAGKKFRCLLLQFQIINIELQYRDFYNAQYIYTHIHIYIYKDSMVETNYILLKS